MAVPYGLLVSETFTVKPKNREFTYFLEVDGPKLKGEKQMALINLGQIKGGTQLQTNVNNILNGTTKLLASNINTAIVKTPAAGSDPAVNYTVEEYLGVLNTDIATINDRTVKDVVRLTLTATYDDPGYTVTVPSDLADLVPSLDNTVALPVYDATTNKPVYNATGAQLTYSFNTGTFSGVPSTLDIAASKAADPAANVYSPIAATFTFKVFPTGTFKFSELPAEALLDNTEMQTIAYAQAIDAISLQLSKDEDVINAIAAKVGTTSVAEQIEEYFVDSTVDRTVAGYTASDEKVLTEAAADAAIAAAVEDAAGDALADAQNNAARVDAIEELMTHHRKAFAITGSTAVTSFDLELASDTTLSTLTPVTLSINGLVYTQDTEFTVASGVITWTFTEANNGFDITEDVTDYVYADYYTGAVVARTVAAPTPTP